MQTLVGDEIHSCRGGTQQTAYKDRSLASAQLLANCLSLPEPDRLGPFHLVQCRARGKP